MLILIGIWLIIFLSLPVIETNFGYSGLISGIGIGVLIQSALVVICLTAEAGLHQTIILATVIIVLSFIAEYIGVSTGFPFGKYFYTASLQPQIGNVPLLIPFAWLMMLPPSWSMAQKITGKAGKSIQFLIVSSLAFTAWDIFLDPQMVGFKLWNWLSPGQFFGIPFSNYAGWFLAAFIISYFANYQSSRSSLLYVIYILTWLIETVGLGIVWHQPLPALIGFVVMGIFISFSSPGIRNKIFL